MTRKKLKTYLVVGICPPLAIQHGSIDYNLDVPNSDSVYHISGGDNGRFIVDTWAEIRCKSGRARTGSGRRTCQSNGEWNGEVAACVGMEIFNHCQIQAGTKETYPPLGLISFIFMTNDRSGSQTQGLVLHSEKS